MVLITRTWIERVYTDNPRNPNDFGDPVGFATQCEFHIFVNRRSAIVWLFKEKWDRIEGKLQIAELVLTPETNEFVPRNPEDLLKEAIRDEVTQYL